MQLISSQLKKTLLRSLHVIWCSLLLSCFASCKFGEANNSRKEPVFIERDTTITPVNSVTQLVLDSEKVEEYIGAKNLDDRTALQMRSFYNSRNYQFAWFSEDGLTEQAQSFWNLHNQYSNIPKDTSDTDQLLHQKMQKLLDNSVVPDAKMKIETELELTNHFFVFTDYAYAGKLDPEEMQWHIPRKKIDAVELLDSLVKTKADNLEAWEPVSRQYQLLQKELLRYHEIVSNNKWEDVRFKKTLKKGDHSTSIHTIRRNLYLLGDLDTDGSTDKFDAPLVEAVKIFQERVGLVPTGRIDSFFVKALNVKPEQRIEQILINLERMRWLPVNETQRRIVVNIPEFKLHVYDGEDEPLTMKIVVGKEGSSTVIFSDKMKYIVFSPYWNVTPNIVRNEILPAIKRNSNYLSSQNMEVYGNSDGLPMIRQKPGGNNALGKVKFLFPNRYNIYLHDTPAKTLFQQNKRAFSHGCIRISEPEQLAAYLLQQDSTWTQERMDEAMDQEKETWVTLKNPIPVYISYFTAWVDGNGKLNFREDIYAHDKKMAERMFSHE